MTVTLELDAASTDFHTRRTLSEISLAVAKSKKIVVVTGAGISCSCGIPDFRSSDGLYALVKERYPDVVMKGRDLFDASLFRDPTSTAVFYTFISGLKRSINVAKPSPTHHFIKVLDSKKRLLRSYTQNIDGLEAQVGLLGSSCQDAKSSGKGKSKIRTKDVRNVQLHGDIHRVRCIACSAEYTCAEEHLACFEKGIAPDCPECLSRSEARIARSARAIRVGSLRPAIVLYDESHPLGDDIGAIHTADLSRKPDMLIIMGTSLKVHGLRKLVKDFARTVQATNSKSSKKAHKVLFVNKTPPTAEWSDIIDYHISGETDRWSNKVIDDWKKMRPADWEVQQTLVSGDDETAMAGGLKKVKPMPKSSTIIKPKIPLFGRENRGPISPPKFAPGEARLAPPLSPSKRRQKTSHYDDLDSSPSKRQTTSDHYHAMPANERRMLFMEKTNHQTASATDDVENAKKDMSLCDLSMRDVKSDASKMDVSLLESSIINVEASVEERPPVMAATRARSKAAKPKGNPITRMVTRPKRSTKRPTTLVS